MDRITSSLATYSPAGAANLLELWNEYEERTTKEALLAKDIDILDMLLQADTYEKRSSGSSSTAEENALDLSEFFTSEKKLTTAAAKGIAKALIESRAKRIKDKSSMESAIKKVKR
jgi:5'-deoxynucleotidase YfbR-like HD superfamily hydrolase